MDQRRLILFFTLSLGFLLFWSNAVMPLLVPEKPAPDPAAAADDAAEPEGDADAAGDDVRNANPAAAAASDSEAADTAAAQTAAAEADTADATTAEAVAAIDEPPATEITVGSLDPDSGYFMQATITSEGAAIDKLHLNDPRFRELHDRKLPLQLLGDTASGYRTFATGADSLDAILRRQGKTLEDWNWEYVEAETERARGGNSKVVFRVEIGGIEVRKTYSLQPVEANSEKQMKLLRQTELGGYLLRVGLTFRNVSSEKKAMAYTVQGPVGLRLENAEHAREYRKLQVAFVGDQDSDDDSIPAKDIFEAHASEELEVWTASFRYVGVDNTYFAALLTRDPEAFAPIAQVEPMLVDGNEVKPALSDVSVRLTSESIELEPAEVVHHEFLLFAGPKRRELLDQPPLEASRVLNYGMTGFVARWMLGLLGFFHNMLGLPYGVAIICLTVLVRGLMFPLSRKQALSAEKMKQLQPEIQALKDKHGDDREKIAKAQMELFAKHRYNPFAGCLPLFVQLPVFIGLYTALYQSVDLRLARFLWIDNLAAPDATFRLPFSLPFGLGQDFNILPILTVALFVAQQKMFMPPATTDEQRMQQKLMMFMTIGFGFFFWHSPSGLCLYFIASSLWGLTERKLLARMANKKPLVPADESTQKIPAKVPARGENDSDSEKKPGFFERKMKELVDAAAAANEAGTQTRGSDRQKGKKKKRR